MTSLRHPDYDSRPHYTAGDGWGWVGYGIFMGWASACLQIFDWGEEWET